MASSTGTFCDICQSRHISKVAEEYCPLCEETLCTDCKDHHKLSKATKTHQAISIDEFNKLPPFIREIKQHCDEHGDSFEFFCPTHNELCCKRCITTTHCECKGSKVIEDFVQFSKSSAAIYEYKQTLEDVDGNIQNAIFDRKYNLEEFEKQIHAIRKKIQDKKAEINKHFEYLESTIMNELLAIEGEKTQNVRSVIAKLEEIKKKNLQLRKDVDAMKKYGTNIQVFMGTIKLQQPVSSQEKFVRALQDDGSLRFINLECSISEKLNGILTGIGSFGMVTSSSSDTRVRFRWESDKSSQKLATPTDMHIIDNINTKLICKIDVSSVMKITSCVVGKYVMFSAANYLTSYGNVLKYDGKGKYLAKKAIQFSSAFNIVSIDSDSVAITDGGYGSNIHIVDVATLHVKRVINLGRKNCIYGASYENGSIIGCMNDNSIKSFNIAKGKNVTASSVPFKTKTTVDTYLASDSNHLYHSEYHNDSVTCYELEREEIIWAFKDAVLQEPRSVCLDSNSNVYVAGSGSNNVVVISSDGLHSKQLLGPNDGIRSPHAIHYDKTINKLLVVNEKGPAFLYQVSK